MESDGSGHAPDPEAAGRDTGAATRSLRRGTPVHSRESAHPSTGARPVPELTEEAIRGEEIGRLRITLQVFGGLAAVGLLLVPTLEGDPRAKLAFVIGLVTATATMGALWWMTRERKRYSTRAVGMGGVAVALAMQGTVVWFGIFSSANMIGSLALYIFCLGATAFWSLFAYALVALTQATLAALVIFGHMDDVGMITAGSLGRTEQITIQLCVQAVYAVATFAGMTSRRKLLSVFAELASAARRLSEREVLLSEAKRDLERAARIGGEGRYTGQTLGSFRLGNLIGRGGMGEVYEALDEAQNREAAVKLLHAGAFRDPESATRFTREARLVASIDSPHVVRVLEISSEASTTAYLAMERLRGEDLGSLLRRKRKLSTRDLQKLCQQVGAGLDAAHEHGVVHRDLKPQNLFLAQSEDGSQLWKVLDFGVAKELGQGTLTGDHLIGTPEYMAPEQAAGKSVSHHTDLYGLCAVLYRCLLSRPPFSHESLPVLVHAILHDEPPRPSSLARVTDDLDAFFAIGLAKNPLERFDSAADVAESLRLALAESLPVPLRERARAILARAAAESAAAGSRYDTSNSGW